MASRARPVSVVAAVIAVLGMAGCYGSTGSATDVGTDRAQLHGKGTTNNGPAHVFFRVWPTQFPSRGFDTRGTDLPGGVSGPYSESTNFSEAVTRLVPATSYSFRLCGTDQGASQPVCAQTETFKTTSPNGDVVQGYVFGNPVNAATSASVGASSDPGGAHPTGGMTLPGYFSGSVTCLRVQGSHAVVGAVGTIQPNSQPATGVFEIEDGGAGADDQVASNVVVGSSTPPDCASVSLTLRQNANSTVYVYDAP
jgi:hypothetical protein